MKAHNLEMTYDHSTVTYGRVRLQPGEAAVADPGTSLLFVAAGGAAVILVGLSLCLLGRLFLMAPWTEGLVVIRETLVGTAFWRAAAIGLLAQAIDGALGMAYGVTATTFLLGAGVSPMVASASVHMAEIFTTGFSGIAHVKCGNVQTALFLRLLGPGILGAVVGAVVVTQVDGTVLRPFVSGYLVLMGLYILGKAMRHFRARTQPPKHVAPLALLGGFVDTLGGGGWGPVVTSTLLGAGHDPRTTIGSVNFAEFFLALASAVSLSLLMTASIWPVVAGLVCGGLLAAPFAAVFCKHLRPRVLLLAVGLLITALSLYNLYYALG